MANALWPAPLPQMPLARSLSFEDQDSTLRFQPDVGDAITRSRYTARARTYGFIMLMSDQQLAVLEIFYASTLANGSKVFDFLDPVTRLVATFRFAKPYQVSDENGRGLWRVSISLMRKAQ